GIRDRNVTGVQTCALPISYPPAGTGLAIQWGLDDGIKTPYAYTIDFSIGRELPGNVSLEVSYVGRLAHRLLSQQDLAMPLNIVEDRKSTRLNSSHVSISYA